MVFTGLAPSPTATTSATVSNTSLATITQALQTLSSQPFQAQQAGITQSSLKQVYSSDDAKLAVNASFSAIGLGSASDLFNLANDNTKNHIIFTVSQAYFTLAYTPDGTGLGSFFAPATTVQQASQDMGIGNPPLFVSSVTYGSKLYFMCDTTANTSDMEDSLSAAFSSLGYSGSVSLSASQKAVMNTADFHIFAIGGRASGQIPILLTEISGANAASGDVASALAQYIKNTVDFSGDVAPQEVGLPISYSLAYLDFTPVTATVVTAVNPTPISPNAVSSMNLHIQVTDNDKEKQTGVSISVLAASGVHLADDILIPSGSNNQAYYWNDNTGHDFPIQLSAAIPFYDLPLSQFTISAPGDSWHGSLTVTGLATDGNTYTILPTTPGLFFNDGGNKNPLSSQGNVTSAYCYKFVAPPTLSQAGQC